MLPASLAERLRRLSREEGTTLFMTLLAAYKCSWHVPPARTTSASASPSPTATAKRSPASSASSPTRWSFARSWEASPPSVRLLRRVRERALGGYAHQDLPFEKLVEELQPERALSHTPLFQVMFSLREASGQTRFGELQAMSEKVSTESSKCDLVLAIGESAKGMTVRVEYSTALFEEQGVERLLGHYEQLLEAVVADADRNIWELELLTEAERQEQREWNATEREYAGTACLHELFERQVAASPDAQAVVFEGQSLTYAELNARANQLARTLRARGVGREVLVGICVERSLEMVVGLLGILKAGGAYVPLDPGYPTDRLAYMLENSGAGVVLTQGKLARELEIWGSQEVLSLDEEWETIAGQSGENLGETAGLENLAYMIYTSGSTGKPKGAMNAHRGICNRLFWMQEQYRLEPGDRVLQKTPFSFDVSVWEFFWPLITGTTLVVAGRTDIATGSTWRS